jgi:hypothetical protein
MSRVDPETGIWDISIAKKRHQTDYILAAAIYAYYDVPKRMADLGCGLGYYCKIFGDYGWEVIDGYEGTEGIGPYKVWPWIYRIDLSVPVEFVPYDFVLCLEVGEHIPKEREQVFIDNVVGATGKDLVMSWAVPGQYSASGHVNNRPNEYIIEQMRNRGLKFQKKMTRRLRYYSFLSWFKNTVMVFRR